MHYSLGTHSSMIRPKRFVSSVILLLIASSLSGQNAASIARQAYSATILIATQDSQSQPLSLGSGFFIDDGVAVTNAHVLRNAASGYVKFIGDSRSFSILGVLSIDIQHDLVVLRIGVTGNQNLNLADSDAISVGDTVYAVGNPRGLEGTFSDGIVSGIRRLGPEKLLQITAPISPGSSGGPVLNTRGEVVGIAVSTILSGQNLNFAVPANYLRRIRIPKEYSSLSSMRIDESNSYVSSVGNHPTDAIEATHYASTISGFSFSIRNRLRSNVRIKSSIMIFYDENHDPIDVVSIRSTYGFDVTVPAGLAKRIEQRWWPNQSTYGLAKYWEYRVLEFEIVR